MSDIQNFKDYLHRTVQKAYSEVVMEEQNPSRILDVHPSSLPFCGYSFLYNWLVHRNVRPVKLKDELILGTGTHFHEVIEKYMSTSGADMYGQWYCTECGNYVSNSLRPEEDICPECGSQYTMHYQELGIDYRGVVGHIDTILRDPNGDLWIVDYKTTTQDKLASKAKEPGLIYKTQVMTYALMVRLQYNLKVKGVCLLFMSKEKPAPENISMWVSLVTKEDLITTRDLIKKTIKLKNALIQAKSWDEIRTLPMKPCDNPWCPVCRGRSEKEVRQSLKELCEQNSAILPIINNVNN